MEQFNCRFLELTIRIQSEVFSKTAFFDDVKDNINLERKVHRWSFGSQANPNGQHAHLVVDFEEDDAVTIVIIYHWIKSEVQVEDIRPPYMEDCARWLSGFIETEKVIANLQLFYSFDDAYVPRFNLPFPLLSVTDSTEFSGAMVSGIAIRFQEPSEAEKVIIERFAKNTLMSIYSTQELALKDLVPDNKVREFLRLTQGLMQERHTV
jgi:hypothetical protein